MKAKQSKAKQSCLPFVTRNVVIGGVICGVVALASPAMPYSTKTDSVDPQFSYQINVTSFANLNGHTVSTGEARFWTQYSLSQWISRSGVPLTPTYGGDTTADCEDNNDGVNTVGVKEGCKTGCPDNILGWWLGRQSGGEVVEFDICLYDRNNGVNWEIWLSSVATGEVDMVAVLTHEWGHWLGLNHSSNTTMNGGYQGQHQRYPHGDDIEGLRAFFSAEGVQGLTSYWRERTPYSNSWSPARSMGGSGSFQPRRAAIGADNAGVDYVVSSAVDNAGNHVHFKRAQYPLGVSASWTNYAWAYDSWVTPAISSNNDPTSGAYVAAWPEPTTTSTAVGDFRFIRSTTAFLSGTVYTKTDMASLLAPTIEWVEGVDGGGPFAYFLLLWLDYDPSTPQNTGEICYRTSADGTSWSSVSRTGIYALDTPGLACNGSQCQLSYVRASSDTTEMVNRAISMAGSGAMTLGSYVTDGRRHQRESDVAYGDSDDKWLGVNSYTTSYDWRSRSWGSFYTYYNVANPIPTGGYSAVGESSEHPAKLAANDAFSEAYLFYVD